MRLAVQGPTMRIWLRVISSGQAESSDWWSTEASLPHALRAVEEAIAEMREDCELDGSSERYLVLAAPEKNLFYLFRISG